MHFVICFPKACAEGFYGNACSHVCGHCVDHEGCHHINGSCLRGCTPGYTGNKCDLRRLHIKFEQFDTNLTNFRFIEITLIKYYIDL